VTTTIDLSQYRLGRGSHQTMHNGMCAMELASHLAGERWSAAPKCVCQVIQIVTIMANDGMDDETRNRLVLPLIPSVLNTRGSAALELRRAVLVMDWCQRIALPPILDRVEALQPYATALRELPEATKPSEVVNPERRGFIRDACRVAHREYHKCGVRSRVAAGAAISATRVGQLGAHFGNPARDIAIAAGVSAGGDAFEHAFETVLAILGVDAIRPTIEAVWELYPELIRRLVAVTVPAD
jgi:hypothetical protein